MRAQLKKLHSPDVISLEEYQPEGPFGILVTLLAGPADAPGEESFDIFVCTPDWFAVHMEGDIRLGRHHLFVRTYDYRAMRNFLETYCRRCEGNSWREVAEKLAHLGRWEFEGYLQHK